MIATKILLATVLSVSYHEAFCAEISSGSSSKPIHQGKNELVVPEAVHLFSTHFANAVFKDPVLLRTFAVHLSPAEVKDAYFNAVWSTMFKLGLCDVAAICANIVSNAAEKVFVSLTPNAVIDVYGNFVGRILYSKGHLDIDNCSSLAKEYARILRHTVDFVVKKDSPKTQIQALSDGFLYFMKSQNILSDSAVTEYAKWFKDELYDHCPTKIDETECPFGTEIQKNSGHFRDKSTELDVVSYSFEDYVFDPTNLTPPLVDLFCRAFSKSVKSTPSVRVMFDVFFPPTKIAQIYYNAFHGVMDKAGLENADFVARIISQAVEATFRFLTPENIIDIYGIGAGTVLYFRDALSIENISHYAQRFANILKQEASTYKEDCPETIVEALIRGFQRFLIENDFFDESSVSFVALHILQEMYSMAHHSKKLQESMRRKRNAGNNPGSLGHSSALTGGVDEMFAEALLESFVGFMHFLEVAVMMSAGDLDAEGIFRNFMTSLQDATRGKLMDLLLL